MSVLKKYTKRTKLSTIWFKVNLPSVLVDLL